MAHAIPAVSWCAALSNRKPLQIHWQVQHPMVKRVLNASHYKIQILGR